MKFLFKGGIWYLSSLEGRWSWNRWMVSSLHGSKIVGTLGWCKMIKFNQLGQAEWEITKSCKESGMMILMQLIDEMSRLELELTKFWMLLKRCYCWWEKSCTTWDVKKPCKQWDPPINWCRISSINSISLQFRKWLSESCNKTGLICRKAHTHMTWDGV